MIVFYRDRALVLAYLTAFMTAAALTVTDEELIAYIGLFTEKTLHTEVLRVIEGAFVPGVHRTVELHFFGDSDKILTEELSYILKRPSFVKCIINILSVIKSKVFLVSWYQMKHSDALLYLKTGGW